MKTMISLDNYTMVQKLANKMCYGNTHCINFDNYVSVGLNALVDAIETYNEAQTASLSTYCYRCVLNAMINEQLRLKVHELPTNDGASEKLEEWNGAYDTLRDDRIEPIIKSLIRKAVKNNDRNAQIVELHIGLTNEPMDLKDIADMFALTHESVRLVCKKAIANIQADKKAKELLYSFVG